MEAENETQTGERNSSETSSATSEGQLASRLRDLTPEKDPMGADGKPESPSPAQ